MNSKFKKICSFGLVLAAVGLTLTACSGKKQGGSGNKASDTKHSIALITDSNGVDDHSFNQAAWSGFKAYGEEHGLKRGKGGYQYFQSNSASDYTPNFNQAASAGYQTIYGVGYMLADSVKAAAKKNPNKNFVIIDSVVPGMKNVVSATFESNQASYLGGLAAALTTKTNNVGFIGGAKSSIIDLFEAGFKQGVAAGAKMLHKKITVQTQYIGNFTSTDKAKSIAQSMYANKADIIYQAAGSAGNGVFQEAKDYNQLRPVSQKVWVIGVDVDQSNLGKYTAKGGEKSNFTLTSVLKGLDVATKSIADDAYKGKFPGGKHLVYSLKGNGVSITRGNLSSKTWSEVQKAKDQIISGKIKVATTPSK
ncbi:BMP family lipoprotein [Lactobacillus gigeriorum]|uniref:lipoprotein A-antigen n=1 Tax=Lactobacillus gigeriorum DSM 23908 = CRBIP 24.85 TaxID=1423751 RepID=I7LCC1_9LACO|nr:BMP family ABC transporter substrate-binding protein [Lactobacillus gigeriorum]KRN11652.1 lipoprotein a-antigen [Lactobacillus gigeriorum DSM 23908 = CRBIP 24.85]CCI86361.1 Lipoprotein A-antigen [Lactobacillus gigeriorum DSM 23908 = CRBIP 24.85]